MMYRRYTVKQLSELAKAIKLKREDDEALLQLQNLSDLDSKRTVSEVSGLEWNR